MAHLFSDLSTRWLGLTRSAVEEEVALRGREVDWTHTEREREKMTKKIFFFSFWNDRSFGSHVAWIVLRSRPPPLPPTSPSPFQLGVTDFVFDSVSVFQVFGGVLEFFSPVVTHPAVPGSSKEVAAFLSFFFWCFLRWIACSSMVDSHVPCFCSASCCPICCSNFVFRPAETKSNTPCWYLSSPSPFLTTDFWKSIKLGNLCFSSFSYHASRHGGNEENEPPSLKLLSPSLIDCVWAAQPIEYS